MNPSEKIKFIKLFANIAELYSKPLSESMLEIYWNSLKKNSLPKIEQAIHLHLLNHEQGKFMPKPADLLKYLEVTAEDLALNAWSSVIATIESYGIHRTIVFTDPHIRPVIDDMGGWFTFCKMPTFQLLQYGKEFQQRYLSYQRANIQIPIKPITGIYADSKPILIGPKTHLILIQEDNHD